MEHITVVHCNQFPADYLNRSLPSHAAIRLFINTALSVHSERFLELFSPTFYCCSHVLIHVAKAPKTAVLLSNTISLH